MGNDKQIQKAGDNSQQIQATNVTVVSGIDEKRVREIFFELFEAQKEKWVNEAQATMERRNQNFVNILIPKMGTKEPDYQSFAEPSFLRLVNQAQIVAASTDRVSDYELLSELLVHRVQNKEDRKVKASIAKAVEIVDQVDDDALCALTIVNYMNNFRFVEGNISACLDKTNDALNSLNCTMLPSTTDWMAHLDVLNAIRVSDFGRFHKFDLFLSNNYDGFTSVGIEKGSPQHQEALRLLHSANLPPFILVEHELLPGYKRLAIGCMDDVAAGKMMVFRGLPIKPFSANDARVLKQIWSLYCKDSIKQETVKTAFVEKCKSFDSLNHYIDWYNQLPHSFTITPVGRVLAHSNAERFITGFPKFNP